MNKIQLLAPAGNLKKLKVALAYGADAVYIGGKQFSLRARASNFDLEAIKEAVQLANKYSAKIYVTCNIIAHREDLSTLDELKDYLLYLQKVGVKGIIVADFAIIKIAKEVASKLEIHISTQLSSLNSEAINFYEQIGATRVVLGRECTLKEIASIKENSNLQLEVFIHGGMCMAISGKCVLSNYLTTRDANRGGCAHSCRWYYDLYDKDDNKVSDKPFTFSSKDLQTVKYIKKLINIGVSSLKIEGRMKSEHYLGTVIGTYRRLIDDIYAGKKINNTDYIKEINKAENRPTSSGFLQGEVTKNQQIFDRESELPIQNFVGEVLSYDGKTKIVKIEQRNHFFVNEQFEVYGPNKKSSCFKIKKMWNEDNEQVLVAPHAQQILYFKSNKVFEPFDIIRVIKKESK